MVAAADGRGGPIRRECAADRAGAPRLRCARLWRYSLSVEPAGDPDREGRTMACLDRAEPACPVCRAMSRARSALGRGGGSGCVTAKRSRVRLSEPVTVGSFS